MKRSIRFWATLQALLVTFLWSTSWVFIKTTLNEIPPILFAGLRYLLASLILLPAAWKYRDRIRQLSAGEWRCLAILGVVFYTLTQGGQYLALDHLEAITLSLLLNLTVVLVAFIGIVTLKELPSKVQWAGIILFLLGLVLYFYPVVLTGKPIGYFWAVLTVCANAVAALMGRSVNKRGNIPPMVVTVISMGIGALLMMGVGLAVEDLPAISTKGWLVIFWLAAVNTAFAFTLWNKSLKDLTAVESSIINNTMFVQIALLAWVFLGERLNFKEGIGCLLVVGGVLLVQLFQADKNVQGTNVRNAAR